MQRAIIKILLMDEGGLHKTGRFVGLWYDFVLSDSVQTMYGLQYKAFVLSEIRYKRCMGYNIKLSYGQRFGINDVWVTT